MFCAILAGDEPASFVYRDDLVAAFMDMHPVTPGHLLVVPVQHGARLADVDAGTVAHAMRVAHGLVGSVQRSGLRCEGINLWLADGAAAMQDVFHVHLHVIPRFAGDGFGLKLPPDYPTAPSRSELDDAARRISAQI